jgi:hypothetical protein
MGGAVRKVFFGITVICLLCPSMLKALQPYSIEILGGRIGIPVQWDIYANGIRAFPISGQTVFTRLGCEVHMFHGGQFIHGDNNSPYDNYTFLPARVLIMLYPGSIRDVGKGTQKPFYVYLFAGGGVFGDCHKSTDGVRSWSGGSVRYWNVGITVSYMSFLELETGYMKSYIKEHLGVDAEARFMEFVPYFEYDRLYITLKLSFNTALFLK